MMPASAWPCNSETVKRKPNNQINRTMRHFNRLISVLALLLAASASQADNYFTIGENDTLSIAAGCDTVTVPVRSHFDGRVQAWNLTLTWPEGLEGIKVSEGPGMMSIPYRDSQGEEHNCNAVITASPGLTTISSIITQTAYWPSPYGGSSLIEGKAMWEPGDYGEMFYLTFKVGKGFTSDKLAIDGMVTGYMQFGGVGSALFYRPVTVVITRVPGDVNGDGRVTIGDVTALINLLLTDAAYDPIADITGDGKVTIADVTALINRLLTRH